MIAQRVTMILLSAFLAMGLAVASGAWQPVMATQVVTPNGTPITLDVNKGTLVRVDKPVTTVFVADPGIADIQVKSPTLIYIFANRVGETVLYGVTDEEEVVLSRTVRVSHNLSRLQGALDQFLPGTGVRAVSVDGALLLEGQVTSPAQAEDARRIAASFVSDPAHVVNRLDVTGPNQVNLRVRIAEVSRDVVKQLGINWETVFNNASGFLLGVATARDFIEGGTFLRDSVADSLVFSYNVGGADLNILIDALEEEDLISLLAEPNLTAMSGETANFLAGGEFPVPVAQDEDAISISFKEFGVALAFTPTIIGNNRINLRVAPEVSQLSTEGEVQLDGFSIPALTTRRAETTVELASGQSFAVAGLLQNNVIEDVRKFPGLGDLPVLGRLFRSESFVREETELIIVVTPYLVRPVSSDQIVLPGDGLVPPDDYDRIVHGKMYEQQEGAGPSLPLGGGGNRPVGPFGYVLE